MGYQPMYSPIGETWAGSPCHEDAMKISTCEDLRVSRIGACEDHVGDGDGWSLRIEGRRGRECDEARTRRDGAPGARLRRDDLNRRPRYGGVGGRIRARRVDRRDE